MFFMRGEKGISIAHQTIAMALCISVLCLFPVFDAHAQLAGVLCGVWFHIHDDIGRAVGSIAIAALGVGAMLGKVSWGMMIAVAVGISIMFAAEDLARLILGPGLAICH